MLSRSEIGTLEVFSPDLPPSVKKPACHVARPGRQAIRNPRLLDGSNGTGCNALGENMVQQQHCLGPISFDALIG